MGFGSYEWHKSVKSATILSSFSCNLTSFLENVGDLIRVLSEF